MVTACLAVLVALGVETVAPAGAHSILVSSTPAAGAELPTMTELRLEFASALAASGHVVTAESGSGQSVPATAYELTTPNAVVARFDPGAVGAGSWEVVWEVVAADGHRERGRIPVTVTAAPSGPSSAPTTASPAGGGTGGTGPSGPGTSTAPGAAGPPGVQGDASGNDGGSDRSSVVAAGVVVVLIAAAGAGWWAYRSRRPGTSSR